MGKNRRRETEAERGKVGERRQERAKEGRREKRRGREEREEGKGQDEQTECCKETKILGVKKKKVKEIQGTVMRNGEKSEGRGETLSLTIRSSLVILGEPLIHTFQFGCNGKKTLSLEMIRMGGVTTMC